MWAYRGRETPLTPSLSLHSPLPTTQQVAIAATSEFSTLLQWLSNTSGLSSIQGDHHIDLSTVPCHAIDAEGLSEAEAFVQSSEFINRQINLHNLEYEYRPTGPRPTELGAPLCHGPHSNGTTMPRLLSLGGTVLYEAGEVMGILTIASLDGIIGHTKCYLLPVGLHTAAPVSHVASSLLAYDLCDRLLGYGCLAPYSRSSLERAQRLVSDYVSFDERIYPERSPCEMPICSDPAVDPIRSIEEVT